MTSVTPVMNADGVGAEKQRRGRHLVDRRQPPERTLLLDHLAATRPVVRRAHAFGAVDRSGRQAVDADPRRPPFDRERARQRVDAGLRRRRVRLPGRAEELQRRADVQDRPAMLPQQGKARRATR